MTNFQIRTAIEADLPTLDAFEQDIVEAERPYDPTLKADFQFLLVNMRLKI